MEKTLKMSLEQAKELYRNESSLRDWLLENFTEKELCHIPEGVWCMDAYGDIFPVDQWCKEYKPTGVVVSCQKTAFVVGLHADVTLQWGAMDKNRSPLVTDMESFNSKSATDAIINAYEGVAYKDNDNKIWNVDGSPAATWCRNYSSGSLGVGEWDLPTLAQLKVIHKYRDKINDALVAMGGYKLVPNYYWSSTSCKDLQCAFRVSMYLGDVYVNPKYLGSAVRAVSPLTL